MRSILIVVLFMGIGGITRGITRVTAQQISRNKLKNQEHTLALRDRAGCPKLCARVLNRLSVRQVKSADPRGKMLF